ncbi:MAG: hypothetical protein JWM80_2223 [Cyanobacteria bacterium RYN_339]|nr:hypothetical protein [Cyanobacteria bacterium RYN_339]
MHTREIPKPNWGHYLEALGNHKAYQPVRVQVEGETLGAQPLAESMPLVGISVEAKGSRKDAIELTLGGPGQGDFTHLIEHPAHLWVEEDEHGEVQAIDIEDELKIKTLIFFARAGERPPMGA